MKYRLETITPAKAEWYLKNNPNNRRINDAHVRYLAEAMERGEWMVNGESIKFNGNSLLDGQHRLMACIKCGIPLETLVIRELTEGTKKTIDAGRNRTANDILTIDGEINTALLAATINKVVSYDHGKAMKRYKVTNLQVEEFLSKNPDVRNSVLRFAGKTQKIITPSLGAACHYIFSRLSADDANIFFDKLIDGTDLSAESPILLLRNRLIFDAASDKRMRPEARFGLAIKAWNLYRRGDVRRTLSFRWGGANAEPFPTAI